MKTKKKPKRRCPKNEAEGKCFKELTKEGWDVSKRGWPDFICEKDGKFIVIEVKKKKTHSLKYDQERVMKFLSEQGIECYRYSPDVGLVKYK